MSEIPCPASAAPDGVSLPLTLQRLVPYLIASLSAAVVIVPVAGLNRAVWRMSAMRDYKRIVAAGLSVVAVAVALDFAFERLEGVARALPILQAVLLTSMMVAARVLSRLHNEHRRTKPAEPTAETWAVRADHQSELVVGFSRLTELYLQSVSELGGGRIAVAGLLGRNESHNGRLVQGHTIFGTPESLLSVLRELEVRGVQVDRVVVTVPLDSLSTEARDALTEVERSSDIKVELLAEKLFMGPTWSSSVSRNVLPMNLKASRQQQLFTFDTTEIKRLRERPYWRVKRVLDLVVATTLLVLLLPILTLVSALVAMDVGLPVVFWQQRPGLGGRPFRLYKLRTMGDAHDSAGRRRADEDRISNFGRLLRRSRLDELPQLLQVLTGKMSIVGPRPLLPIDQSAAYSARLLVRPGLTGWAQVMGGRDVSARDKAALDVWYVKNASLALDLRIVLSTIPIMLFGERVSREALRKAWRDHVQAGTCSVDSAIDHGLFQDGAEGGVASARRSA